MKYSIENIADAIKENERRLGVNNAPYDPLVGTEYCDTIKRNKIEIEDAPIPVMYIPVEMEECKVVKILRDCKTLAMAGKCVYGGAAVKRKSIRIWHQFIKQRCKYDAEFFFVHQIVIIDKETKRDIPFVLNRAQRYFLSVLEKLRKSGEPIDIILLKARQWGGSTLTEFYMNWIQRMWKIHWNAVICADIDNQAKKVMGMMERAMDKYDLFINNGQKVMLRPYMRTDSTRIMEDRGCTISIGSAQHPEALRCEDICMAHLTEVGLWKRTLQKSPEDLVQSIFGSVLSGPYSLKVLESTAKGVGNFFHNTWLDAVEGKNNFHPVFVPWYMIDLYTREVDDYIAMAKSMNEEEWWLFNLGATFEAIYWYRYKAQEYSERWRLYSEFPSTPEQAFQSTGSNYFDIDELDELYQECKEPILIGDVYADSDRRQGALNNITLRREQNGNFKVWADVDKTPMRNRYLVTVDLGKGHSQTADNSVICVFDRYWQTEVTGIPEVVAEWAGHMDMDLIAWKAAQIATYYNNALLVIEDNSLIMSGIDYFMGVLVEIKDYYPNIYRREIANKTESSGKARYGWRTDGESKPRMMMNLKSAVRRGMYIERSKDAVHEMKVFEEKPNGELGAVEGCHDDRVITRAIGVTFMFDRALMPPPIFVEEQESQQQLQHNIISDYTL